MIVKIAAIGIGLYLIKSAFSDKPKEYNAYQILKYLEPHNGKAVKTSDPVAANKLYKLKRSVIVPYTNHAAYVKDGSPEIVTIPKEIFDQLPIVTNALYTETGYKLI